MTAKERRVDPQIIVGLLVDRGGFPLRIGCWEGDRAETTTIVPVVREFVRSAGIEHLVVVADAGMLSAANLAALDEAGVGFIVGSRMTRAPVDLAAHFRFHGDVLADGQIIDTITPRRGGRCAERDENLRDEPVWDPATHPGSWRAVWVYSAKRFARDSKTLTAQESRARAVVAGRRRPRGTRFVTTHRGDQVVDEAALARARRMAGLKGYVSNIPAGVMGADEVIASYHELWHVEQSFRMTRARPENPPDLPPHPRRDRGPPDRRDGLPGRRPPPATGHRDEHQATRPRTQTTSRGHHQRQRPPPHRPTPTHRNRTANPQQSGSGALNWHDSGDRVGAAHDAAARLCATG